jgi:hypothetical protein
MDAIHTPKWGQIYQITTKLPNCLKNMPNWRHIFQMGVCNIFQMGKNFPTFSIPWPSKFLTKLGFWV